MKGKLFTNTYSAYQLCDPSPDKIQKCPTRRSHGCGGDGDEENCMSIKYVPLKNIDAAKKQFPNIEELQKEGLSGTDIAKEMREWFFNQFGSPCDTCDLSVEGACVPVEDYLK